MLGQLAVNTTDTAPDSRLLQQALTQQEMQMAEAKQDAAKMQTCMRPKQSSAYIDQGS